MTKKPSNFSHKEANISPIRHKNRIFWVSFGIRLYSCRAYINKGVLHNEAPLYNGNFLNQKTQLFKRCQCRKALQCDRLLVPPAEQKAT